MVGIAPIGEPPVLLLDAPSAAATTPSYFHLAPNGRREPYSAEDNASIFAAQSRGDVCVSQSGRKRVPYCPARVALAILLPWQRRRPTNPCWRAATRERRRATQRAMATPVRLRVALAFGAACARQIRRYIPFQSHQIRQCTPAPTW